MREIPQLKSIAERLREGNKPDLFTPRELLAWFGYSRRTWLQTRIIDLALSATGLRTEPGYEGVNIDDPISIVLAKTDGQPISSPAGELGEAEITEPSPTPTAVGSSVVPADPVHRVGRFMARTTLVKVARDQVIEIAITQMLMHDYSQLPVMQGERQVEGMVSWQSIGQRRALGASPQFVRDCIEPHYEVSANDSIFDAIRVIQQHECVLVRSSDNRIVGILTATDISGSFEQLSSPFLLLSYIENHLRAVIHPKFCVDDLQTAKDPSDVDRQINDVSDMTFGEYIRLLENPANWEKLGISIERGLFVAQLNEIREIRNDVMHFNPEGIEDKDMETLRRFNSFLASIVRFLPHS